MHSNRTRAGLLPLFALALISASALGQAPNDGGMWPYDNLPLEHLEKKYGFTPEEAWISKLRLASVRVSTGGSGSFVSPQGLVLTNHHVALELVNELSNAENDLVTNGFHARELSDELKCPGASLSQLVSIDDVTQAVQDAAKGAADPAAAAQQRAAKIAALQTALSEKTGLTVEVVTLYGGGQYAAYGYKVYDDIRLVFAPEMRAAYYGGDFDNFTYPRYCLDMAFLRAYEDGKPADTSAHYFGWNPKGAAEGELTFVSGNPGRTSRLWPLSRKRHDRDGYNPMVLTLLAGRELALATYAAKGDAERLEVLDELFGVRNSQKAYQGMLDGLRNPELWARLTEMDAKLRKDAAGDEGVEAAFATYDETAKARDAVVGDLILCRLEGELGRVATQVFVWMAGGSSLAPSALETELNPALERERLIGGLSAAKNGLAADHPFIVAAFQDGETPAQAADRLIANSFLLDGEKRRALLEKGKEAVEAAKDPIIALAAIAMPRRNAAISAWRSASAREEEAGSTLARARFKLYGKSNYPDATFTLRLSIGVGKRYTLGTTVVPWITTFHGLYNRHASMGGEVPFDLPQSWLDARDSMDLTTPYNFVSTHDIIGGNSGSPVVNKNLEIIGLIFDGNIQSLPNNYLYLDKVCRSVSVHSAGMTHALERVYKAYGLLAELGLR